MERQPVQRHRHRRRGGQRGDAERRLVDRVVGLPRPRGVPGAPGERPGGVDVPEAARVQLAVRRLHHDDELLLQLVALEQRRERALVRGQLLAREEQRRVRRPREHELDHHRERAQHVRRAEPGHAPVRDPPGDVPLRRNRVQMAGEQHLRPQLGRVREHARVARDPRPRRRPRAARKPRAPRAAPRCGTRTGCRSARASARPDVRPARTRWARGSQAWARTLEWVVLERSRNGRTTESRPAPPAEAGRAKQRAFCIAASEETPDLEELKELLRTAGVATVGELTQKRDSRPPEHVPRLRQGGRAQVAAQAGRRERRRRRRRAHAAPAAQPGGRARHPGARPHRR